MTTHLIIIEITESSLGAQIDDPGHTGLASPIHDLTLELTPWLATGTMTVLSTTEDGATLEHSWFWQPSV